LSVDFAVEPSADGATVLWMLKFSRAQFHNMLDSTAESADLDARVYVKVRELITAGLNSQNLGGLPRGLHHLPAGGR
jgi:hypothetical protein